uniref:PIG-L family deacetylase n=1 Tax=Micromonospora acroterricola TaxID=2202421 RepID=UPI001374F672|nr:PIG-L family deacetylase [Micromonospora acroterricola]
MTFLAVVAHPDDDLLFLNPDLSDAIRARGEVTTVYITAGQGSGTGATAGERARSRQRGICDAYAHMAGYQPTGDQSEWSGELIEVGGKQVERYTLDGRIRLLWLALPDGQLTALEAGTPQLTVEVPGGLGAPVYGYNRADVVAALRALIDVYQPGEVCTLDPWPESRYEPHDHADHTVSARLAGEAATAAGVPALAYRGYSITAVPATLAPQVAADKRATFDVYAAYDDDAQPYGWCERMLYRWPRGNGWVGRNADGRLQVFSVRAGRVVTWWQVDDWTWSQPRVLGGSTGPIAPGLAIGYDLDGRMELLARRLSDHRIVCLWQTSPSGPWASTWSSLGNHNAGQPNEAQMGVPTVTRHADGRLCLLVKNGGGGVSSRSQTAPGAGWGPWTDLGGTDIQDGVTAAVGPGGRIEVFAGTTTGLLHWYQTAPNGPFKLNPNLPSLPAGSPPSAVRMPDGRLLLVYRTADSLALTSQAAPDGPWEQPVVVSGPGGHGQVTAATCSGRVWLACRDADGGVSATSLDNDGLPGDWVSYGQACDVPALAVAGGVPHLFVGDGPSCRPLAEATWTALP